MKKHNIHDDYYIKSCPERVQILHNRILHTAAQHEVEIGSQDNFARKYWGLQPKQCISGPNKKNGSNIF